jgi:hypothetical protein
MSVTENCNLKVTLRNFNVERGVSSMKSSAFCDVRLVVFLKSTDISEKYITSFFSVRLSREGSQQEPDRK